MYLVDLSLILLVSLVLGPHMLLVSTVLWVGRRRMSKMGKGLLACRENLPQQQPKRLQQAWHAGVRAEKSNLRLPFSMRANLGSCLRRR